MTWPHLKKAPPGEETRFLRPLVKLPPKKA